MPNLKPPVTTTEQALGYRQVGGPFPHAGMSSSLIAALVTQRIMSHVPPGLDFTPLMTLYLTDVTT
jgi:dihydroorotase